MPDMIAEWQDDQETDEPPNWQLRANCRGLDPSMFFTRRGDFHADQSAKAVCRACPVKAECLELGMTEREGIWGGLSARERRVLRRRRGLAVAQ